MATTDPRLERIDNASCGDFGLDQQRIALAGIDWLDLMLRKNKDYGSAVWEPPVLRPAMDPGEAILVRMSDKIQRLQSILSKKPEEIEIDETVEDTIRDLGAYCLLWLARPQE